LERQNLPLPPGDMSAEIGLAIKAWNWLGGQIDWAGLPMVAELLGIDDLEVLIVQLTIIRDSQEKN
jgi:hypothetical protein